jgi:hypothetical protein
LNVTEDDEAARAERAKSLREEIAGLKSGRPSEDDVASSDGEAKERPRDFVERRMSELAVNEGEEE